MTKSKLDHALPHVMLGRLLIVCDTVSYDQRASISPFDNGLSQPPCLLQVW
jgi:hypothetical protein